MLTPNDGRHVLSYCPKTEQLMSITGMDEAQYRWFCRQAILHSKLQTRRTSRNFTGLEVPFLIQLAIGSCFTTYCGKRLLLAPKTKASKGHQPEQTSKDVQGQTLVNGARYTPKSRF